MDIDYKCLKKFAAGFTLVEMMAVIFVIAVMISVVSISIGGIPERKLASEAQRLYQKIRILRDYSEDSGYEMGVSFSESGYEFYRFDEEKLQWKLIEGQEFSPVKIDDSYTVDLNRMDSEIDTQFLLSPKRENDVRDYGEKEEEPEIIFFSDGQLTPFEIKIGNKNVPKITFLITGAENHSIKVEKRDK